MARHFNPYSYELYSMVGTPSTAVSMPSLTAEFPKHTLEGVCQYPNKPRIVAPVNFSKQTARPSHDSSYDPHPRRFVPFNTKPQSSSKTRRVSTPNISRFSSRPDPTKRRRHSETVSPQMKFSDNVWILPFDKQTDRPPFNGSKKGLCADIPLRTPSYAAVDSHVKSPSFKSKRPSHDELPLHMVKVRSRLGVNLLSEKMLEMNMFSTVDWPTLSSTFGSGWTPKKFKNRGVTSKAKSVLRNIDQFL